MAALAVRGGAKGILKNRLRHVGIALGALAVLLTAPSIGQYVAQSQGSNTSPLDQLHVQGIHHRLGFVAVNAVGKQLTIDDVVVSTDRIAVHYHAAGVQGISFSQVAQDPRYRTESPTLIRVTVDGQRLAPLDAWTQGEQGSTTREGEFIVRWGGGMPKHIHISVERIEGDLQATWEVDADL